MSVCGEMAGDVAMTRLLLGLGLRSFSMHPAQIASVKRRILRADTRRLSEGLSAVLASDDPGPAYAEALRVGDRVNPARTAADTVGS